MIRRATNKDIDQLVHLFDLYRQFYNQESNQASAKAFIRECLEKNESTVFVADPEDNSDNLAGFVQLYPSFTSIGLKKTWILNDLFVHHQYRKSGFGEKLILAASTYSQESGARSLMLQTAKTNEVAQKLYEKLGWVRG